MIEIAHFIDNARVAGTSGRSQPVFNPATGAAEKTVALATRAEVNRAVAAAAAAWPTLRAKTPSLRRARILDRFKTILWERADQLAEVISAEHGKTHDDAKGEVTRGLEVVEFAAGAPHLLKGETTENVGTGVDSHSLRQPVGVVAGVTPFNFPVMVPMWMFLGRNCLRQLAPSSSPSERDPLTVTADRAEWLAEAGLPEGRIQRRPGRQGGGRRAPRSTPTSRRSASSDRRRSLATSTKAATANGKRVQALGGAKNHMVIMPDADLDMAVNALMGAAYGSAGERCMAISVAVPVTDKVADALIERLVPKIEALKVGPAADRSSDMGPLVTAQHLAKVRGYIDAGESRGRKDRGRQSHLQMDRQGYENGYYIGGSLIDEVTPDATTIWKEEIFGPVLSIVRRKSFADAVDLISAHEYANGVAVFTRDGTRRAFAHEIQVGMVGVNVPIPVPMAFHSFGGWKASLFGDHHMHGPEGVRFYTRLKTITTRWPTGARSG